MERQRWLGLPRRWAIALALFIVTVLVAGVLGLEWMRDGRRRLDAELAALRTTGAPEFIEQIVFSGRKPGEDPEAWLRAIPEAHVEWSVEDLSPCAQRLANGESSHGIESDFWKALEDPRRVTALTGCELAILSRRLEVEARALELAMQIDGASGIDWIRLWSAREEPWDAGDLAAVMERTFQRLLVLPPIPGYIHAIELLCCDAVGRALDGDIEGARHRLSLAGRAVALFEQAPTRVPFQAWSAGHANWIRRGILPLVHLLPAGTDWSEIDALLAATDVRSQLIRALEGERALGNTIFRSIRSGDSGTLAPSGWYPDWARNAWSHHDHATYLERFRPVLAAAREPAPMRVWDALHEESRALEQRRKSLVHGLIWKLLGHGLAECGMVSSEHALNIHLCRAAILARSEGADAALAFLATERDPYDEAPLRSRLDPDGILVMWSVGPDRTDDPASNAGEPYEFDDLRVAVRVK